MGIGRRWGCWVRRAVRIARRPVCEAIEQRQLLSSLIVTDPSDDGSPNTLRWAIQQVDAGRSASAVEIDFNIPGSAPMTIRLASPLPSIVAPVFIDGTTEPGFKGSPVIEIDGSGLSGGGNNGLVVLGGGSMIRGLSIVGFSGSAIVLQSGGGDAVAGNELGLTPSGASVPNGQGIALLGSSYNTVGAGPAGPGNVISGNTGDGVLVEADGPAIATGNLIDGNLIGTSADGLHAIGNGGAGIDVIDASGNSIGMPGMGLGNVVSGNLGPGISLSGEAAGNTLQNNLIGVALDGRSPLGNWGDGIRLDDAPGTVIGGKDPSQRNIISANRGNGIVTADDTAGLLIAGNSIGTDATGTLALGNLQNGICLASSSNSVGSSSGGAGNVIAFNGTGRVGAGVQLVGKVDHNAILSNSIEGNAGLGINFGSGPTPNHAPGTVGPNDYQNYPTLASAQDDGTSTTVTGSFFEAPSTSYLIQFFWSPQPDPSGYGQGQYLLGATSVQTNAQGNATFTASLPSIHGRGEFISATATDPSGNTSEFSAAVAVQGLINLVVSGAASPNPVPDGSDVAYTITVANQGTADAHYVALNDQLPAGVSLVGVTTSQGYVVPQLGGSSVAVALGTIAAGSSATVIVVGQTGPGVLGTITDMATVTSLETDPNPSTESVAIPVEVEAAADLAISMAGAPSPVLAGGVIAYTMTVTDLGPQASSNVRAALPLAPGLAFVSATSTVGSAAYAGGQVVAGIGDLDAGGQAVVTVTVRAAAAGSVPETATVTGDSIDPVPTNNTASVTTEVDPAADLSVQVAADTRVTADGIPFDYTVTVVNNGSSTATAVVLTDTLPAGAMITSVGTSTGATPAVSGGTVSLTLPTLAAGASASLTITAVPTAPPGSIVVDSATVQGAQADPDPSDNTDALSLPVRGVSDLAVTATAQSGPAYAGQPLTITVNVTNNGPADEPDAVLSSVLPSGLVIDSTATATEGLDPAVDQGIMTADLGPLPAGQSVALTLVVTPAASEVGPLSLGLSVQGQDFDPELSDNTAAVTVPVAPSSDLSVQIAPSGTLAVANLNWIYSVTVSNAGPSTATGVVATIPMPSGVQFVSALPGQGTVAPGAGGSLVANLGTIASGGSATVAVVIDPTSAVAGGTIALIALAGSSTDDPNPANNQVNLDEAVAPSVHIALTLGSTPQVIQSGQVVTFTALVSNIGTIPATGVIVAFPQVSGLTFLGSDPSQGSPALVASTYFARLGDLAPGSSATVTVRELATAPGTYAMSASVAEDQYNLDVSAAAATVSAQVVESPGMVQFGTGSQSVTDQSGLVVIPVVRLYGASGTITVHYQTLAIDATPGLDFTPTAGTITLGPGQWSGSIQVLVLDDPYRSQGTSLNVTMDSPTGGAVLGPITTSVIQIQDVDPDRTPPQVSNLGWTGTAQAITSLTLQFTSPLDPSVATNADDYHLTTMVGGQPLPIASIRYNATNFTVTIVPQSPIPSGEYARLQVSGTGAAPIRDLAGNLLDGDGDGTPGSDYAAEFAQGTRLKYVDHSGDIVTLRVKGRGLLQQLLDANGNGVWLNLVGEVPHRTMLRGNVRHGRRGRGQTQIGQITGLGQFGDVKVRLKSPPFRVTAFPFQRRGRFVL